MSTSFVVFPHPPFARPARAPGFPQKIVLKVVLDLLGKFPEDSPDLLSTHYDHA
jgi:hypothetical protein